MITYYSLLQKICSNKKLQKKRKKLLTNTDKSGNMKYAAGNSRKAH